MWRRLITCVVVVLSFGVADSALGATWTNADPADNHWTTPGNWDGGVPTADENAEISNPDVDGPLIADGMDAQCMRLRGPGYSIPPGTDLTITGGSLTFNRYWRIGFGGATGTVNMSGGTITNRCNYAIYMNDGATFNLSEGTVKSGFYIPSSLDVSSDTCTLNVTGGTVNAKAEEIPGSKVIQIGAEGSGYGLVNLHGGAIITNGFTIGENGKMDITEGTLQIDGGVTSTIEQYVNDGLISAYNGSGVVAYSYDDINDVTVVSAISSSPFAVLPTPRNGEKDVCPDIVLEWRAGDGCLWHDIYFGTDFNDVNDAVTASDVYVGRQNLEDANYDPSGLLDFGQAYYWRVDEVNNTHNRKGKIWSFEVASGKPTNPGPANLAWRMPVDANLVWEPSCLAEFHDVYFGTDFNDVNVATTATSGVYKGRQTDPFYEPGGLAYDTTYYWRVDEVGGGALVKGDVWQFTTVNAGETLLMCDVSVAESTLKEGWTLLTKYEDYPEIGAGSYGSDDGALTWTDVNKPDGTATTIDVTLDVGDSGNLSGRTWGGEPLGMDFFFANDQSGSPDADFIITLNDLLPGTYILTTIHNNTWYGYGAWPIDDVTVTGGASYWAALTSLPAQQTSSATDIELCRIRVEFDVSGAEPVTIRYRAGENAAVFMNGFILDFFPPDKRYAYWPAPRNKESNVQPNVVLGWYPGIFSSQHDIYFGASFDDVNDADTTTPVIYKGRQGPNTYNPGMLELDSTYYWRVDEVNAVPTEIWKGNVWSFKTANHIMLDDFESYHEDLDDLYFFYGGNWLDGIDNGTGSTLYLGLSSAGEPTHGGGQSLYYNYFNSFGYSEAERVINTGERDWSFGGLKMLTLFFYGDPGNAAGTTEQMYCGIEDAGSSYADVQYGDQQGEDMNDVQVAEWQEWNIAISGFTGTSPSDVRSLFIGFGERGSSTSGGSGTLYFDDICLYLPKCVPDKIKPAYDFSDNCIVDIADVAIMADSWLAADACLPVTAPTDDPVGWWKLDGNADDSSTYGNHGTAEGSFQWITGHIDTGAIEFTGDGGKVLVPNAAQLNPTTAVTAMAWVNYSQAQGYSARAIAKGADAGDNEAYVIQLTSDDQASFFVRTEPDHVVQGVDSPEGSLAHDTWVHVAGSYDGDAVNIYVNGRLADSDSIGPQTIIVDSNGLAIGDAVDVDRAFIGKVDDVRVYNVALSDENIAHIATLGSGYAPLEAEANIYDAEPAGSKAVNFKDLAELMTAWLEQELWPQ